MKLIRFVLIAQIAALLLTAAPGRTDDKEPTSSDKVKEEFTFDGSELSGDFKLHHDIQSIIYEAREVDSTCSRQVLDGYDTRCHTEYESECSSEYRCSSTSRTVCEDSPGSCHTVTRCPDRPGTSCREEEVCTGGGRSCREVPDTDCGYENVCHSVPRERCEQHPRYRTEHYACKKTISVPIGQERRLLLNADVSVVFNEPPKGLKLSEQFVLKLEKDDLTMQLVKASGEALIFEKVEKGVEEGTKLKNIRARWELDIVAIEPLLSPIKGGIQNLREEGGVLKFDIGRVSRPEFLAVDIELKRNRAIVSDVVVFNGEVTAKQLTLTDISGDRTEVSIPLSNLAKNEPLKAAKYKVAVAVKVASPKAKPLNTASIPDLKSKGQVEFKLK